MVEKVCEFTACGDKQGVLYWMGTKKGLAPAWENPAATGAVEVCMSSVGAGDQKMVSDVTFSAQVCHTKNEINSWIGVDLKTAVACPTIYTFAHQAGAKDFFIRSWWFQGSADGVAWDDLDDRTDDATMNADTIWAAYAITPTDKFYRFFRIKMKPQGNTRKTDTLILSCFEMYGKAREAAGGPVGPPATVGGVTPWPAAAYSPYGPPGGGAPGGMPGGGRPFVGWQPGVGGWRQGTKQEAAPSPHPPGTTVFDWRHNGDRRGILFYLGTGCGAGPWQNPVTTRKVNVSLSSLWTGKADMVGDHTLTNQIMFTRNDPETWMQIDLQSVRVCPSGYSMAHRADMSAYFVRNWLFQGSNDGMAWDTIYQHANDNTLNEQCLHGSWAVQSQSYYRIFRIFMFGNGNSRSTNTLVCTCFDLYGTMAPL